MNDSRDSEYWWCDKRVTKFLKSAFKKETARNLREVYLILCEIDSDVIEVSKNRKMLDKIKIDLCETVSELYYIPYDTIEKMVPALIAMDLLVAKPDWKDPETWNLLTFEGFEFHINKLKERDLKFWKDNRDSFFDPDTSPVNGENAELGLIENSVPGGVTDGEKKRNGKRKSRQ